MSDTQSTKTWVKASVALPPPRFSTNFSETKSQEKPKIQKQSKQYTERNELISESKTIDFVPSYIIAFIQIALLVAKVVAGYIYQDQIWQNIEWLWILSPLWVTHAFAIIWLIATIGRKT
jgi:hypothetical protein